MPATALHLAAKAGEMDDVMSFMEEEAKEDPSRYILFRGKGTASPGQARLLVKRVHLLRMSTC